MKVYLRLYGPLRDKLPKENKGRATLNVEEGTTVGQALARVEINWQDIMWAVNEAHENDSDRPLEENDELSVFTHVAGG
ncbi:MAG: molybdopterin converting factor small subunit [Cellvibrionaceae bacterium]|jgi:molybdopterin converting factor small subunit